jgi:hypothetical protein
MKESRMNNQSIASILIASATAACISSISLAQHVDITITVEGGRLATTADLGAGLVPQRVFSADFGALGVPDFTDEPGFLALPGTFTPGTRVGFNATAGLRRFTGTACEPVANERIEAAFLTLAAILGTEPSPGIDLAVQSDGGWHRHFNFTLFAEGGKLPADGIYVVELELYSTDGVTAPSAPFWIVFNDERTELEHDAAIAWVEANLATNACTTDLDGNGETGSSDLTVLLSAWATPTADLNGDGNTDSADLTILLSAWGTCG